MQASSHSKDSSWPLRHYELLASPVNHVRPLTLTTQLLAVLNPSEPKIALKADPIQFSNGPPHTSLAV
jgi:hypothetical protein